MECSLNDSRVSRSLQAVHLLYTNNLTAWPNFSHCLPDCSMCQSAGHNGPYTVYNLVVTGILLPLIGLFGLIANSMSAFLYTRPSLRSSTNMYLAALACSDCCIILTALFLFFGDSFRRYSLALSRIYGQLSPVIYPAGLTAQTGSVYFTVCAAIDCFVHVCLPARVRTCCGQNRLVLIIICLVVVLCIAYNIPHCFETLVIDCFSSLFSEPSLAVCAHPIRFNPTYLTIYYKYLYTIFLAVGPLSLLIMLNVCIIAGTLIRRRRTQSGVADSGDTISLVLVVLLFIVCNMAALLLNMFEQWLVIRLGPDINYVVDLSNLLVVINSSANFIIYYSFGHKFRHVFWHYMRSQKTGQRREQQQRRRRNVNGMVSGPELTLFDDCIAANSSNRIPFETALNGRNGTNQCTLLSRGNEPFAVLVIDQPEVLI